MPKEIEFILKDFVRHVVDLKAEDDPAGTGFHREFRILREEQIQNKNEDRFSTEYGRREENLKKNRYKDILPRDDRRVKLTEIEGEKGSDYINASFIDDVNGEKGYIAAQGPMPHTVYDFWRMMWQHNTEIVFMVCKLKEDGRPKCEKYWADDGESATFGDITVHTESEEEIRDDFYRRQLRAEKDGETHTLTQFHYVGWPDHNIPSSPVVLRTMIEDVRTFRQHLNIPMVVHCSAGCGRTGTICAIDFAWNLLDRAMITEEFSMFEIIKAMREQRMSMVQTPDQYEYTHMVMKSLCNEWLVSFSDHDYENVTFGKTDSDEEDDIDQTYANMEFDNDDGQDEDSNKPVVEKVITVLDAPREVEKKVASSQPTANTSLPVKTQELAEVKSKAEELEQKRQTGDIVRKASGSRPATMVIADKPNDAGEYVEVIKTATVPPLSTAPQRTSFSSSEAQKKSTTEAQTKSSATASAASQPEVQNKSSATAASGVSSSEAQKRMSMTSSGTVSADTQKKMSMTSSGTVSADTQKKMSMTTSGTVSADTQKKMSMTSSGTVGADAQKKTSTTGSVATNNFDPHKTVIMLGGSNVTPKIIKSGSVGVSHSKQQAPRLPAQAVVQQPAQAVMTPIVVPAQQQPVVLSHQREKPIVVLAQTSVNDVQEVKIKPAADGQSGEHQNSARKTSSGAMSDEDAPDLPSRNYRPEEISSPPNSPTAPTMATPAHQHTATATAAAKVSTTSPPQSPLSPTFPADMNRERPAQPLPVNHPPPQGVKVISARSGHVVSAGTVVSAKSSGNAGNAKPGGQVVGTRPVGHHHHHSHALPGMVSVVIGATPHQPVSTGRPMAAKGHPTQPVLVHAAHNKGPAPRMVVQQPHHQHPAAVRGPHAVTTPVQVVTSGGKVAFLTERPPRVKGPKNMPAEWSVPGKNHRGGPFL